MFRCCRVLCLSEKRPTPGKNQVVSQYTEYYAPNDLIVYERGTNLYRQVNTMGFFNFGGKKKQEKQYEALLEQGIQSYNAGSYDRAVEVFDQAVEIRKASYEKSHSDADRSTLCDVLMFRGKSLFMMKALEKAHSDFIQIYDLLGNIAVQQSNIKDCKLLRQACEFGAATAEQTGDTAKRKELVIKRLDISRRIFEVTEMAEDYIEIGDSYDYMITISESIDERIHNAEEMKKVYQNLHKQFPDNAQISERLDYAYEALDNHISSLISEAIKREDFASAASNYERLTNVKMEMTLGKKSVVYEDLDKDVEYYHKAAKCYEKAGDIASAIRCLESAIQLRNAIVEATGSDVARARLCYSYVMTIVTDPTIAKRAEYAKRAYAMLDELEKKRPEDSGLKQLKEMAAQFLD